jgi:hypothetical protein
MMKKSSLTLAFAAAVSIASLSVAAPAPGSTGKEAPALPAPVKALPTDKTAKSPPNFDAMFALMDKLFPPQPDPDPGRLALARTATEAMWPNGAYGKMMTGFMGGMFDRMMQLKTSDLAALSNKPHKSAAPEKDVSLHEQVAGKDPYFDQRMAAMRDAVEAEMGKISAIIDPRMREGLARATARRFDARQLGEINLFFASPTGKAFAGQYMQLWIDPDTIRSIFSSMPEMMKLMPELMQKLKAADEKFPKRATPAAAKQP